MEAKGPWGEQRERERWREVGRNLDIVIGQATDVTDSHTTQKDDEYSGGKRVLDALTILHNPKYYLEIFAERCFLCFKRCEHTSLDTNRHKWQFNIFIGHF